MADRYWVGGSGSWNSTTKWSTTSGGASGASVPTASDNAIFDANSGASHYTVTVTDNSTCANLTFTPVAADGVTQFAVGVNFVIAGTFSTSGTQGNRRAWFRSSTYALTRDMQIATIGTVTDVDFRDIRVTGTGGTLTGTRIGDLRGNVGITFSTAKNCYRIGSGNWSEDQWAATSGGTPSTDFFPLAQDTAIFDENTSASTNHTMDAAIPYTGALDMSARTSSLTLSVTSAYQVCGNWTNGTGITISGGVNVYFSGRNTQVITSAGVSFGNISPIVETYNGTVELADAFSSNGGWTILAGTFDTKSYNLTATELSSSSTNVREIKLGASTVTLSSNINFTTSVNLTLDAGTSLVVSTGVNQTFNLGAQTFYDVSLASTTAGTSIINQSNTFNNLSITPPTSGGVSQVSFAADQTITGTLTAAGASAIRRVMLRSSAVGTPRTLTVGTLSADDCDFRDITIAGTAAGGSPTRAGDCGGNSDVNFPAPKTVYWNLAGTQNWSADGWATTSGGVPATNNFPLAQDTAVFDDTGSAGTVTVNGSFNIGVMDLSARTTAMTLQGNTGYSIYGNWTFGSGVTHAGTATITFAGRSTQTITSNGKVFAGGINIDCGTGTVQLADALELNSARILTLVGGTFDTASYNVTAKLGSGSYAAPNIRYLKMGASVWTCPGTGSVWSMGTASPVNWVVTPGTYEIILSDTGTGNRTFDGSGYYFNKLTIGGATGTSTTTISGSNTFGEFASTKTVAHTIAFGTTIQTFGKWSVSGSSGNVVTLTGTSTSFQLKGACTSGIDYLDIGSIRFQSTSPGEFYAGANSVGSGTVNPPNYLTAKPADTTLYWVGGTGNWSDTNKWSTTSGGAGGAGVPRSHDAVVFDANSSATSYTVTVNFSTSTAGNRCNGINFGIPASGNLTFAGSTSLYLHGSVSFPASNFTRTYTGTFFLSGTGSGKTFSQNGVPQLASSITLDAPGAEWALGSALNNGSSSITISSGSFDTAGYNLTFGNFLASANFPRTITLGASTVSVNGASFLTGSASQLQAQKSVTFSAGTSQINFGAASCSVTAYGNTFYNVAYTSTGTGTRQLRGSNTFNNLSLQLKTTPSTAGVTIYRLHDDQTINGTLTFNGTPPNATCRTIVDSGTKSGSGQYSEGTTLTCNAVSSVQDVDFYRITIAGAAVSGGDITGTRLGDCGYNSGIAFGAGVNKYWNLAAGGNWYDTAWATTSGGAVDINNLPLPQDTCIFQNTGLNSGATVSFVTNRFWVGNLDFSARTNSMIFNVGTSLNIIGNWIQGTGVSITGTATILFVGSGTQNFTTAGKTFSNFMTIDKLTGSVVMQDAFNGSGVTQNIRIYRGTFDANGYNVTIGKLEANDSTNASYILGSGTCTITGSSNAVLGGFFGFSFTASGTISFTSSSSKNFNINEASLPDLTINQGGSGQLVLISNYTLKNITNTYSATGATTIKFNTSTQRVSQFTAAGTVGKVLTLSGSSATSPCTLIHTGTGDIDLDYVNVSGVRAY